MYRTVGEFEKSFPAIKKLAAAQKAAALDIFNSMMEKGESEGKAIATAIKKVENTNMSERIHYLSNVSLSEGETTSEIELLRVGVIRDRGLRITRQMLEEFAKHYEDGSYGTEIQVNLGHNRDGEAAGWIKKVFLKGDSLMGGVGWTELGIEKLSKNLFKFISAELALQYPHPDTGKLVSNVLIGAALTNTPALKRQQPITLSEEEEAELNLNNAMFKKYIENLKSREKLSKEDVVMAKQLLSEASSEDQEAMKGDVADIEKKQTEQEAAEEKAAKEAKEKAEAEAAAAAKKAEDLKEKGEVVSLSEHMALKEKVERNDLKELVQTNLILSEKHSTGFRDAALGDVIDFMLKLSEDQRTSFVKLMEQVVSVDFSTRGSTEKVKAAKDEETKLAELKVKAEALAKEQGRPLHIVLGELISGSDLTKA